jgi:hypothetical protein
LNPKPLFARLSKVEEQSDGTCIVRGRATAEEVDSANEIFDWETGKPQVEKWRDACLARSFGKSLGNIRAMHPNGQIVAAGIAKAITFDDGARSIDVESHIIDLAEARKCIEGVTTGYSIGGSYIKRWADPAQKGVMRYTPELSEISLVDAPCLGSATFTYVKVDGSSELRKFAAPAIASPVLPDAPLSPSEVNRMAKAVAALGEAKAASLAAAAALAKKLGLRKSMWDVGTLAQIMTQISYMEESLTYEADYEGDASPIPAQLRSALIALKQIFIDLATEEVTELVGETPEAAAAVKAAASELTKEVASMVTELNKAIALTGASTDPEMKKAETHLKAIGAHVDKIAKAHADMATSITALQGGEEAPAKKDDEKDAAEKAAAAGALSKAAAASDLRFSAIEASIAKSNEVLSLIAGRLVATPVAAVAVAKAADVPGAAVPAAITDPTEAIKAAHAAGMTRRIA